MPPASVGQRVAARPVDDRAGSRVGSRAAPAQDGAPVRRGEYQGLAVRTAFLFTLYFTLTNLLAEATNSVMSASTDFTPLAPPTRKVSDHIRLQSGVIAESHTP